MVCTHGVGLFAIMALLLGLHRAHFTYASSTVPIDEDTFDFSRYSKEIPRMARPFARKALNLTEEELKNMHPMDVAVLAKDKMESLPSWMASRFDIPPPEVVAAWERKKAKEKAKKEAEEKAKKEAEEKAKKEAEEKAKKEAEEAAKKKAEEAAKKKAEEAKKKAEEAAKKKAEEAKKKAEEKAKKEAEEGTESEYEDAKDEFEEAKDKFEEAKDKFESAKETFEEAVKEKHELAKKRYEEAKEQFEEAAKEKYEEAKKRYEEAKEQYEEAKEEVKEEVEEVKEEVEEKEATSVAVEPLAKTSGALEYADALRGLNLWVPVLILSCLFLHYYKHFCRHCRGDRSTKHQHCCQPDSSMPVSSMVADSETDSKPSATTVLDEAAKVDILSPSVVQPGNQ